MSVTLNGKERSGALSTRGKENIIVVLLVVGIVCVCGVCVCVCVCVCVYAHVLVPRKEE